MANQPFKMFSFQSQDPKIEDSDEKNNQESEEQQRNQTFLMIWNTKPNPNYKLQFYNYYSDQVGIEFSLKTYNKFTTYHNPKLKHYLRFSSKLIPDQIEATKNLFYNSFMSDPYESQIIMKPYIGQYSYNLIIIFLKEVDFNLYIKQFKETHKKIFKRRNELPLNKFHQIKRQKTFQKQGENCKKLKKKLEIFKDQLIRVIQMKKEN